MGGDHSVALTDGGDDFGFVCKESISSANNVAKRRTSTIACSCMKRYVANLLRIAIAVTPAV